MSEEQEEFEIGPRPEGDLEGILWDMGLQQLVDFMYLDMPFSKEVTS